MGLEGLQECFNMPCWNQFFANCCKCCPTEPGCSNYCPSIPNCIAITIAGTKISITCDCTKGDGTYYLYCVSKGSSSWTSDIIPVSGEYCYSIMTISLSIAYSSGRLFAILEFSFGSLRYEKDLDSCSDLFEPGGWVRLPGATYCHFDGFELALCGDVTTTTSAPTTAGMIPEEILNTKLVLNDDRIIKLIEVEGDVW